MPATQKKKKQSGVIHTHKLRSREGSTDLSPDLLDATPDTLLAVSARAGIDRVPVCVVASASTANVEDGCSVFLTGTLAGELLVEVENCALRAGVHVAGTAAAAGIDGASGGFDGGWSA